MRKFFDIFGIIFFSLVGILGLLTWLGPWDTFYTYPKQQDNIFGATVYVDTLPVWFGTLMCDETAEEHDRKYLESIDLQLEKYKAMRNDPDKNQESVEFIIERYEEDKAQVEKQLNDRNKQ